MQSLNTIPDGHVTDKLANRLYDRISANGWPKLGGYPVVTGRHKMPAIQSMGTGWMVNCEGFWHEQLLAALRDGPQSGDFCGGG